MSAITQALNELFTVQQTKTLLKLGAELPAASATVRGPVLQAATVAAVASANAGGTYTVAEQTLINELKTQFNALRTSLRNAGIVA